MLFKSFTGLTVIEFDDIYKRETTKRHDKYEIQRLSAKRKERERPIGAGRHFKLNIKNRFLMLLAYYRLCITYTLTGFLFDLDQSSVCRDIQKIGPLVRRCLPIPQKMHNKTKRLQTPEEVEKHSRIHCFHRLHREQQTPRPENRGRRKTHYSGKRKMHAVKTQIMVNNHGAIIHKTGHRKGRRHDYISNI